MISCKLFIYLDFEASGFRVFCRESNDAKPGRREYTNNAFEQQPLKNDQTKRLQLQKKDCPSLGTRYPSTLTVPTFMLIREAMGLKFDEVFALSTSYFGTEVQERMFGQAGARMVYGFYDSLVTNLGEGCALRERDPLLRSSFDLGVRARKVLPLILAHVIKDVCLDMALRAVKERTSLESTVDLRRESPGLIAVTATVYPYINWPAESRDLRELWTECLCLAAGALRANYLPSQPSAAALRAIPLQVPSKRHTLTVTIKDDGPAFPSHVASCTKLYWDLYGISPGQQASLLASMASIPSFLSSPRPKTGRRGLGATMVGTMRSPPPAPQTAHLLVDVMEREVRITCLLPRDEESTASLSGLGGMPAARAARACSSTIFLEAESLYARAPVWRGHQLVQLAPFRSQTGGLDAAAASTLLELLRGKDSGAEGARLRALVARLYARAREELRLREALWKVARENLAPREGAGGGEGGEGSEGGPGGAGDAAGSTTLPYLTPEDALFAYDSFMADGALTVAECDMAEALGVLRDALGPGDLVGLMAQAGGLVVGDDCLSTKRVQGDGLQLRVRKLNGTLKSRWAQTPGAGSLERPAAFYGTVGTQGREPVPLQQTSRLQESRQPVQAYSLPAQVYQACIVAPFVQECAAHFCQQLGLPPPSGPASGDSDLSWPGPGSPGGRWGGRGSQGSQGSRETSVFSSTAADDDSGPAPGAAAGSLLQALRRAEQVNVYWAGSMCELFPLRYGVAQVLLAALTGGAGRRPRVRSYSFRGCEAAGLWAMVRCPVWPEDLEEGWGEPGDGRAPDAG